MFICIYIYIHYTYINTLLVSTYMFFSVYVCVCFFVYTCNIYEYVQYYSVSMYRYMCNHICATYALLLWNHTWFCWPRPAAFGCEASWCSCTPSASWQCKAISQFFGVLPFPYVLSVIDTVCTEGSNPLTAIPKAPNPAELKHNVCACWILPYEMWPTVLQSHVALVIKCELVRPSGNTFKSTQAIAKDLKLIWHPWHP